MNYSKIINYDIANWSGINTTIYLSGCHFKCDGCQNLEVQDFNYGWEVTDKVVDEFINLANDDNVVGVCILGGEPFDQNLAELYYLVKKIKKEVNKEIHIWTGYKYEDLLKTKDKRGLLSKRDVLELTDVLIDGQFEKDKKDLMLKFRGSSNQRVINIQESLKQNKIITMI